MELELEDLQNELAGFKKQVTNVFQKYDKNFQEITVSEGHSHWGWIAHEAAIALINEQCTCGKGDDDDFQMASSPSPVRTPQIPELVPLQVVLSYQVGWVTWRSFGNASDLFIIDATSSGRGSSPLQS